MIMMAIWIYTQAMGIGIIGGKPGPIYSIAIMVMALSLILP